MDRKTFIHGAMMDLLVGVVCGAIMYFSMIAYPIIFGLAVVALVIIIAKGEGKDVLAYCNDKEGNFRGMILFVRIITANVGAFIGISVMAMAF